MRPLQPTTMVGLFQIAMLIMLIRIGLFVLGLAIVWWCIAIVTGIWRRIRRRSYDPYR